MTKYVNTLISNQENKLPEKLQKTTKDVHDFVLDQLKKANATCIDVPKIVDEPETKEVEIKGSPEYSDQDELQPEPELESEENLCDDCEVDPETDDEASKEFNDEMNPDALEEQVTVGLSGKMIIIICVVAFLSFAILTFLVFFCIKLVNCLRK